MVKCGQIGRQIWSNVAVMQEWVNQSSETDRDITHSYTHTNTAKSLPDTSVIVDNSNEFIYNNDKCTMELFPNNK